MPRGTLIHRQTVRRYLLDYARRNRAHVFTQVSPEVYDRIEAGVREQCRRLVHSQPSMGKTIR